MSVFLIKQSTEGAAKTINLGRSKVFPHVGGQRIGSQLSLKDTRLRKSKNTGASPGPTA